MKKALPVFFILFLMGCANNTSPEVHISYSNRIDLPEMPRPMTLLEVKWNVQNIPHLIDMLNKFEVLNDAEAARAKEKAKSSPHYSTFSQFSLDGKNYESLTLNMGEIKRFIEQQNAVIEYFILSTEHTRQKQSNLENNQ